MKTVLLSVLQLFCRHCGCALAAAFLVGTLHAQSPATGTIEGRVFDPRRGEYLENARIKLDGTAQETLTDATGAYRLSGVPAGTAKLVIFYTGLGTRTELVAVAAGQNVQFDITLAAGGAARAPGEAVVQMDKFVASTSREMDGAALAINEQRFARNIVNVVSADEFGTIADGSIGEFMKFLPGITSDYTGGDARRFSINGAPADNVPISMGGFDMASAAGGGTRRAVELDQVSINNVSRIEINRSPTPDTSGSALAGAVNFVPRSAFERSKPSYSYSVAWLMKDAERAFGRKSPGPGWGQETYKIHPGIDLSAVVPVTKTFGFTVSAGYSLQYTPQANTAMQWVGAGIASNTTATSLTGRPATTPDNPYLAIFSWRDSGKNTSRQSFATTVDWKPARHDRLTFGFSYGMLREHFATRTQTYTINRVVPGNWTRDHTWGQMSLFPATGTAINAGQVAIANNGRIRPGRTVTPSLRWLHEGPVWKSDAGVAFGNSRIHYQDIDKGAFNGMTIQRTHVQILFDDIFYLRPGKITVRDPNGAVVDPTKLENYSLVSANSNRQITYDSTRQAFYNVRRDFMVRETPVTIKVGADIRTKVRDLRGPGGNLETYTYVGADGRSSTTPTTQAGLINDDSPLRFLDVPYSTRQPDFGMPQQQQVDNGKLLADYKANPTHWTRNANNDYTALTNFSKRAEEIISAAFIRGDVGLFRNRLRVVGGVRAEQTNIDAEGPRNDPTLNYQRDANGNVIRGANNAIQLIEPAGSLAALQRTLLERGTRAKKEYLRLFPSINASYSISDGLIGRVAYSQSVGRPDFNQFSGGVTLPDIENLNPNSRITVNNASIKAWQAETYMARVEYYFGNVGSLSIGGFIRDYQNFFQNVTSVVSPVFLQTYGLDEAEYGSILVVTQFNNPDRIRQRGFEIDYKQALTFLPSWARGLQFFANISSQRAKGTDNLQDMNPFTANWGLSLTRQKFNIRINENYRGIQRRGAVASTATNSIEPGTYNYRPKRLYIDVTGEYFLSRRLGLFFALRNVGGATEDTKIYGPNTPAYAKFRQRDDYASLWTAGIKGTF
ncbi:MAG: carboxypeptidase regulatory-like domain-containing protein [Opitutaceae bacterium]|nr:carboxypeptidase regulatory-like domain-containing protein [Opitutaceae bacterium]